MFKDVLKSEMKRLNYTAPELAVKLNLYGRDGKPNKQRIYDYLNGSEPPYEILIELSKIFNVSTDYLLGITDYKTKVDDLYLKINLPENLKDTYSDILAFINKIFSDKTKSEDYNSLYALYNFLAWLSFFPNGIDINEFLSSCCDLSDELEEALEKSYSETALKSLKKPLGDSIFEYLFLDKHFFKLQFKKMSDEVYKTFFEGENNGSI